MLKRIFKSFRLILGELLQTTFVIPVFLFALALNWGFYAFYLMTGGMHDNWSFGRLFMLFVLLGMMFPIYYAWRLYRYAKVQIIRTAYEGIKQTILDAIESVVANLIEKIRSKEGGTEKLESMFRNGISFVGKVNAGIQSLPGIVRVPIQKVMDQVPLLDFVLALKPEQLEQLSSVDLADELFDRVDEFVDEQLLNPSMTWLGWLIPLNLGIFAAFWWL